MNGLRGAPGGPGIADGLRTFQGDRRQLRQELTELALDDAGYFKKEQDWVERVPNQFATGKVLTMCPE